MESTYLNDIEKDKITSFLNDEILKEAVRKVLLKPAYSDGIMEPGKPTEPYMNFALNIYKSQDGTMYSDEELGRLTKVRRLAVELIQTGFKELEKMKKVEVIKEKSVNKAR